MAEGGIDTAIDMQRNVRNNTRDMQESIQELFAWEREMRAKEMDMMNSREGRASGNAPTVCRPAAAMPFKACENPDAPVAQAHAGNSPSHQATEHVKPKTAAEHTYEHFKDRWERFDVDAALAEVDAEPAVAQASQPAFKQVPVPIRRLKAPAEDADFWKVKGNEYFQFGDLLKAKECYSKSLQSLPTAVAHANRALACLKLKEWTLATADCSAALAIDSGYLKAWQRRASARRSIGDILGYIQDLDSALRLAPDSVAISRELRHALKDFLSSQELRMPLAQQVVPIDISVNFAKPTATAGKLDSETEVNGRLSEGHLDQDVQQYQDCLKSAHSDISTDRAQLDLPTSRTDTPGTSCTGTSAAHVTIPAAIVRPHTAPATSADFERHWRGLKGCIQDQTAYLSLIEPAMVPKMFGSVMTPGLLGSIIITSMHSIFERTSVNHSFALLEHMTKIDRFMMNWMLVNKLVKADISDAWHKCMTVKELEPWRPQLRHLQCTFQL